MSVSYSFEKPTRRFIEGRSVRDIVHSPMVRLRNSPAEGTASRKNWFEKVRL